MSGRGDRPSDSLPRSFAATFILIVDLQALLQDRLAGHYRVERELGGGGMSRVFLATDLQLDRAVVIKVVLPDLPAALSADRFQREIRVAAGLVHPHVVPLLTSGEVDGLLYYTMPFVEGESLRDRIDRSGPLPLPDAVRILREVADALAHAHARGLVHRDIKPGNVLLTGNHAMVADFGVAKALDQAGGGGLTATGLAIGTPAYMAPEQAAADPQLDHRADIYALGALGYEVLTGTTPFTGPSVAAVLAAQATRNPEPPSRMRDTIPPALDELVLRCLARQPADRFQTASAIISTLETLSATLVEGRTSGATAPVPAAHPVTPSPPHTLPAALGRFAVVAFVVLAAVWAARTLLGLPDWVVSAAVVLLLLGLPLVAAASWQHGRKAAGRALPGGIPSGAFRWLTPRRAAAWGVSAFAALGLVTAGYMSLRALGIGPVGTLVASGRMAVRERVLLAEFVNRTADSLLGEVVTQAFQVDFAQSPLVTPVQPAYVREVLGRMGRPRGTRLDPELAREVAQRDGIGVVIAGEIAPAGSRYILSARLLDPATGDLLAPPERATASDLSDIVSAVDKLSKQIRARIGDGDHVVARGAAGLHPGDPGVGARGGRGPLRPTPGRGDRAGQPPSPWPTVAWAFP